MMQTPGERQLSDEELVGQLRSGRPEAYTLFVDRYFGMVFSVARARLKDREEAEDLAQEVFLRVFLHLEKLQDPRLLAAWLTRIARNLAIDWAKKKQRQARLAERLALEDVPEEPMSHSDQHRQEKQQTEERHRLVDLALERLPEDQRELILLHYSEKMPKNEIARVMGVHPSTVGRQIEKAVATLRDQVLDEVREVRPSRGARVRTVGALAAAAALSAIERSALAASAPEVILPSAAPAFSPLSIIAGILIFIFGGAGVYTTAEMLEARRTRAAIEDVQQKCAAVTAFRYEATMSFERETGVVVSRERGAVNPPMHYWAERSFQNPGGNDGDRRRSHYARNLYGLREILWDPAAPEKREVRFFSNEDIAGDRLPISLQERVRVNDPFFSLDMDTVRLVKESVEEYTFTGETVEVRGHRLAVTLRVSKQTGLLRWVESVSKVTGERVTLDIEKIEMNPAFEAEEFDFPE